MVSPRMLSNENEIFGTGNGLKNRVTACRKRIRLSRFHRTQVITQPRERLLERAHGVSRFPGYLSEPDGEASQPVAELEVGIT